MNRRPISLSQQEQPGFRPVSTAENRCTLTHAKLGTTGTKSSILSLFLHILTAKYCLGNPPIPYIPYTPHGQVPDFIPDSSGCEPAMAFCGVNPDSTQRVDWCGSSTGMPAGMGWSNNIDYAMTTICALGIKYSDCQVDNENGIDVGTIAVGPEGFLVSSYPGYEITSYSIQVGSGLNTAASADFASYQTRGETLPAVASVSSQVPFQGSDWFVMHAMVSVFMQWTVSWCERNRSTS
jgi:hypothetical protein